MRRSVGRGHAALSIRNPPADRFYDVRVTLRAAPTAVAQDQVRVLVAWRLAVERVRRLLQPPPSEDPNEFISLGPRCLAFGGRRVDCEMRDHVARGAGFSDTCESIRSAQLRTSGIVLERMYACGDRQRAVFRRRPAWDVRAGVRAPGPSDFGSETQLARSDGSDRSQPMRTLAVTVLLTAWAAQSAVAASWQQDGAACSGPPARASPDVWWLRPTGSLVAFPDGAHTHSARRRARRRHAAPGRGHCSGLPGRGGGARRLRWCW